MSFNEAMQMAAIIRLYSLSLTRIGDKECTACEKTTVIVWNHQKAQSTRVNFPARGEAGDPSAREMGPGPLDPRATLSKDQEAHTTGSALGGGPSEEYELVGSDG
ncbi:hypothetical protein CEXT_714481 [Caerostris extrusa]|uniref:Uncharacterized protein n=1 Tax=Caerostris extrusa TaxID=172846 RepID=A0AAV4PJ18_CAEEX|nr:hypothetical protein CEXT_714481 [Caerostris extrusa]